MIDETGKDIEATGDSIIIADGLHAIAAGLNAIAKALQQGEGDPVEPPTTYLDGTPAER